MTELNNEAYNKAKDTRFTPGNLGMDARRNNERSALVLLSLLGVAPDSPWVSISNSMLGTRVVMDFIRGKYEENYASSTCETIYRFTLHRFIEALLVIQNPDKPNRPINSPDWSCQITAETSKLVRHYRQKDWSIFLNNHLKSIPGIRSRCVAQQEMEEIPLILPNGENFALMPEG